MLSVRHSELYLVPRVSTFWICKEKYFLVSGMLYLSLPCWFKIASCAFFILWCTWVSVVSVKWCLIMCCHFFFCFFVLFFVCRWQLPTEQPNYLASTANERRRDRNPPPMDPEKLKAVIAGYSQSTFACHTFWTPVFLRSFVLILDCYSWEGISCCDYFGVRRRNSCAVLHSK